jgi:hypothetical protein
MVCQTKLPTAANSSTAIAENTVLVPAGGAIAIGGKKEVHPQLVADTVGRVAIEPTLVPDAPTTAKGLPRPMTVASPTTTP